jgi:16S rRNA (adenine(1408)-N(1))-methyltransferase
VALDFGTGDGSFVQNTARRRNDTLVIGVDANAENLRLASQRAATKPARGGLPNALFGRLALEDAPGELIGIADELSVLLPWGTLLAAVARADLPALARLRGLCRPDARVHVVFGYGSADAAAVSSLALPAPDLSGFGPALESRYRDAGFAVRARPLDLAAVRALPTTWAKKLAFSGKPRHFWELRGRCVGTTAGGLPGFLARV